jgi:hypothetical protein
LYFIESKIDIPIELIGKEIWPFLDESEQKKLSIDLNDSKYLKSIIEITTQRHNTSYAGGVEKIDKDTLKFDNDFTFIQFYDYLEKLGLRLDSDMTNRLFSALTLDKSDRIDANTFKVFIENYEKKEEEIVKMSKFLPSNRLQCMEFAIEVSNRIVVVNEGIGRVILSQKCIYFKEAGSKRIRVLVELKNVRHIEKIEYYKLVIHKKMALKISHVVKSSSGDYSTQDIIICLNDERNLWYLLLNELRVAIFLSEDLKDVSIIQIAAKNSLLLSALIATGQDITTTVSKYLDLAVENLTYSNSSRMKEDKRRGSGPDIKQTLNLRINPSGRDIDNKNSVEVMIYIDIDNYPTIWCAIGNRVKIFDALTFNEEKAATDIKLNEKITTLLHDPDHSKVWMGTIESFIYTIDVLSRTFYKKMDNHSDVVVSIVHYAQKKFFFFLLFLSFFFYELLLI